jgi:multiple sugar transport system substrate-binding protein
MKKQHMLVSVLVFMLLIAVPTSAQRTLQIYGPVGGVGRAAAFKDVIIPKFQETHPDVTVELIQSNSSSEKLKVLIAAGTPPDIAVVPQADFGIMARGLYVEMAPYIEKYNFNMKVIPTEAIKQFTLNGVLYALPFDGLGINVDSLYVNLDLFRAAGLSVPPVNYDDPYSGWTYDQFRQIAKRLTKDRNGDGTIDQWGYAPSQGNGNWFRLIWSFGGDVVTETPTLQSVVNSAEVIEAFQWMRDMKFTDQVIGVAGQFPQGNVGVLEQPLAYSSSQMLSATFDWTVAASPSGKGGRWGIALNNPMGIMKDSKNKDLAFEFMQLWLSDEIQIYLSERAIAPPQTYSAASRANFVYTNQPPYDRSPFVFGRSRSMPVWLEHWPEILAAFRPEVDTVWNKADVPLRTITERLHEQLNLIIAGK